MVAETGSGFGVGCPRRPRAEHWTGPSLQPRRRGCCSKNSRSRSLAEIGVSGADMGSSMAAPGLAWPMAFSWVPAVVEAVGVGDQHDDQGGGTAPARGVRGIRRLCGRWRVGIGPGPWCRCRLRARKSLDQRRPPPLGGKRTARAGRGIASRSASPCARGNLRVQSLMASSSPDVAAGWRASMRRFRAERAVAEA
jgi:hypothetical protein